MTSSPISPRTDAPRYQQPASRLTNLLLNQGTILTVIFVIMTFILSLQSDKFLTPDNMLNQLRLVAEVALVAMPMTLIIITGGIDLSVGSIFGLSAVVLGYVWKTLELPLEIAILSALVTGAVCGLINGVFIVRFGLPPLIMTLGTLALYRGMALGISQARSATGYPEWFYQLGQRDVAGIPTQLYLVFVAVLVTGIILARTPFGRALYAMGNNELGARFSGLPVNRYKILIYTFSGFMAGLAGYIFVSRVSTTRSDMGTGLELDAIAAVVLGGTSIFGGSGNIYGTVIGLVLIQLLKNGLALAGAKGDASVMVVGVVLIAAVLINSLIQRRRGLSG